MIRYSSVVTIARPPADVFEALLDAERFGQWTEMVDVAFEGEGRPVVGTRGSFRLSSGPIKGTLMMQVTELEPDRRVGFRITHPALEWDSLSVLESTGDGTRVTYAGDIRLLGWRRILEPFVGGEVRRGEADEARRLKELLESEGPPSGAS